MSDWYVINIITKTVDPTPYATARDGLTKYRPGEASAVRLGDLRNVCRQLDVPYPFEPNLLTAPPIAGLLPARTVTALDTVHCCSAESLLLATASDSVDMILTSPPYDNLRTYKGFTWNFELIARESYRVLKPGGVLVWVVGDATINGSETLSSFKQAIYFVDGCGFKLWQTLVWSKPGTHPNHNGRYPKMHEYMFVLSKGKAKTFNPQRKPNKYAGERKDHIKRQRNGDVITYGSNVVAEFGVMNSVWEMASGWMITTPDKEAYAHPAVFPDELARRHIETWSNPDDLVMDYFMGSGTTAKIARNLGRRYVGSDISADYVAIAEKRLAQPYTLNMFAAAPPTPAAVQLGFGD